MRTFLIDLENVKNQGLSGVEFLQPEDRVFIFYSESANTLSIPTIQAMSRSRAMIDYVHLLHSGRNAMDFQIVALLGFLIGSERAGQFCIVSQDNGYISPVEFFMDHAADQLDVHVLVAGSIMKAVNKWNALARQNAAVPRVAAAEPVMEAAVVETAEPEPVPEPVYTEETMIPEEKPEQPAVEEPVPEPVPEPKAPAPEPVPAEPVHETAEAHKEEKKSSRKSGNRRRTKKAAEPEEQAPVKNVEEPRAAEPAPSAEEKEPEVKSETKSEPKRKSGSRSGRSTKKAAPREPEKEAPKPAEEQPAEAPKAEPPKAETSKADTPRKRKPIVVSQDLLGRIHEILKETLPEDTQSRNERVVGEALLATETKNEFYQYFRRTMGVQEGGNLYKAVRGEYDRLQKALAETL